MLIDLGAESGGDEPISFETEFRVAASEIVESPFVPRASISPNRRLRGSWISCSLRWISPSATTAKFAITGASFPGAVAVDATHIY